VAKAPPGLIGGRLWGRAPAGGPTRHLGSGELLRSGTTSCGTRGNNDATPRPWGGCRPWGGRSLDSDFPPPPWQSRVLRPTGCSATPRHAASRPWQSFAKGGGRLGTALPAARRLRQNFAAVGGRLRRAHAPPPPATHPPLKDAPPSRATTCHGGVGGCRAVWPSLPSTRAADGKALPWAAGGSAGLCSADPAAPPAPRQPPALLPPSASPLPSAPPPPGPPPFSSSGSASPSSPSSPAPAPHRPLPHSPPPPRSSPPRSPPPAARGKSFAVAARRT